MPAESLIGFVAHARAPAMPPHLVPAFVRLGVGKEAVASAWTRCFDAGLKSGFAAGLAVATIAFILILCAGLSLVVAYLWFLRRSNSHALPPSANPYGHLFAAGWPPAPGPTPGPAPGPAPAGGDPGLWAGTR